MMEKFSIPKFLKRSAFKYLEKNIDFDYRNNTFRYYVKDVTVPTLIIQNINDGLLDRQFIDGIYEDLPVEKDIAYIEIPDKKNQAVNRLAAYDWLCSNPELVLNWFDKFLKKPIEKN